MPPVGKASQAQSASQKGTTKEVEKGGDGGKSMAMSSTSEFLNSIWKYSNHNWRTQSMKVTMAVDHFS